MSEGHVMKKMVGVFFVLMQVLLAENITIAVAANVSYAMEELKAEFLKLQPDTKVSVILASSGKLTAQIKNGAPYGLFMSADMRYPQKLFADGVAITEPVVYAQGSLAYFSTKERDFTQGMNLVTHKEIKRIAIANPKTAPYGKAAIEAINKAGVTKKIKAKLIYAESISQALSYAMSATDIALVAKSSLFSPKMRGYKEGINWLSVEPGLYSPIEQGMVLLEYAKGKRGYKAFYTFMLSDKAKAILKKYGYFI